MKEPMDDLLRHVLRARSADPAAACLDADSAAALVDGTMSARARAAAEAHLADCQRCQALLGALVKAAPVPAARAWWRRPVVAWLAPLTVASAALVIWFAVPHDANVAPVQPPREEMRNETSVAAAKPSLPPAVAENKDARRPEVGVGGPGGPAVSGLTKPGAPPSAAAPPAAAEPAAAASATPLADEPTASRARSGAPPSQVAAADADANRTLAAGQQAQPSAPVEAITVSGNAPVVDTTIASPNRTSQWRIGVGGEVQHSVDGGVTWQTQPTGVAVTPIALAAPSPSVCWLVGPAGLVLLTTDEGRTWRRVPFPIDTDLASVRATDHLSATIAAADGRTFVTSDGGVTWRR